MINVGRYQYTVRPIWILRCELESGQIGEVSFRKTTTFLG